MITGSDTARGRIREQIIEDADETQVSVVEKRFFGDITVIGENHSEAAEYLREKLSQCSGRGDEIRLHFQTEEKFGVALDVGR